ncbi:MAG: JmjC domain-containing protein [Gammaproteobacteria bacterium]
MTMMNPDTPLPHLGGLTATEFLRDYWQKKPLLVRNAFPELAWRLSPEDMMELAAEEGVEARIVLEQGKTPWELRKGPFTTKQFKQLPKSHWTLLVQAVDHYLPELADYLEHFSFVPNWRIDDIMVSYAVEGGSVGPHYDQYDVFLIQGIGQRRWQLGQQCDEQSPRVAGTRLRILQQMDVVFDEVVNAGDMLYVPPGMAHNGVAQNECMTFSIGFRAPVLAHLLERVVDQVLEQSGSGRLVSDAGRPVAVHPGALTEHDLERLRAQLLGLLDNREAMTAALAPFLSEAKYEDYEPQGQEMSAAEIREAVQGGALLRRDPASRCLYTEAGEQPEQLFVNGQVIEFPVGIAPLVRLLADQRCLTARELASWLEQPETLDWLQGQIAAGHWFLELDDDDAV